MEVKTPLKSGKYLVVIYLHASKDSMEMITENSDTVTCIATYDVKEDLWELMDVNGMNYEIHGIRETWNGDVCGAAINYEIIWWMDISELKIPIPDEKYIAKDGTRFINKQLMEIYDQQAIVSEQIKEKGIEQESVPGFNIKSEEDFELLRKYINLCSPYYNRKSNNYEYKDWLTGNYQGEGLYKIVNNKIKFINHNE